MSAAPSKRAERPATPDQTPERSPRSKRARPLWAECKDAAHDEFARALVLAEARAAEEPLFITDAFDSFIGYPEPYTYAQFFVACKIALAKPGARLTELWRLGEEDAALTGVHSKMFMHALTVANCLDFHPAFAAFVRDAVAYCAFAGLVRRARLFSMAFMPDSACDGFIDAIEQAVLESGALVPDEPPAFPTCDPLERVPYALQ